MEHSVNLKLIGVILILGIIRIIWKVYLKKKEIEEIQLYIQNVLALNDCGMNFDSVIPNMVWIIKNTKEIGTIVNAGLYSPIYRLQECLKSTEIKDIERLCYRINAESMEWETDLKKERKKLLGQFFNPFIWFYRGIELVLLIVLGYPIRFFFPNFDSDSKVWKTINTIVSFVGGIASIWSCFHYLD